MQCFNYTCQGESHKATGKVCQDYSYSHVYDDGTAIAVVCDGHGGNRYFRSDVGARLACETTVENVKAFVDGIDTALFAGKPYTAVSATQADNDCGAVHDGELSKALRQLLASIVYCWREKVKQHAAATPITDGERTAVELRYLDDFEGGAVEETYGCTLMAYVATPHYWFAFHLGDGKLVAFDAEAHWYEPVPWDDRCFLNKTTSLCGDDAFGEFRYCYQGDGKFPLIVFLGSDGIDDTYGDGDDLASFYVRVAKEIAANGLEAVKADIVESLPRISQHGSKDDMSVAFIYDEERLKEAYPKFVQWQIDNTMAKIDAVSGRIADKKAEQVRLQRQLKELEEEMQRRLAALNDEIQRRAKKFEIELHYAETDIAKGDEQKRQLDVALSQLRQEIGADAEVPCADSVGTAAPEKDNEERADSADDRQP